MPSASVTVPRVSVQTASPDRLLILDACTRHPVGSNDVWQLTGLTSPNDPMRGVRSGMAVLFVEFVTAAAVVIFKVTSDQPTYVITATSWVSPFTEERIIQRGN